MVSFGCRCRCRALSNCWTWFSAGRARAGLRGVDTISGSLSDVIVEINGKPVRRLSDLTDEIEHTGVGKTVRLSVRRGVQTRVVEPEVIDIDRS